MKKQKISRIIVDQSVRDTPLTKSYIRNNPQAVVEEFDLAPEMSEQFFQKSAGRRKREILLTRSRGHTLKQCPGTARSYICCNYQVINQTFGCPMDCTYCILQFYLNNPVTTVYADIETIISEIEKKITLQPERFFRIGTGELTDSLVFDNSSGFSGGIVKKFAPFKNAILELKTKTNTVKNLIELNHNGRTVIAWSLNPPNIIESEEYNTSSLPKRLAAAKKVEDEGYKLAFHFDPILHHKDWEDNYETLIQQLFSTIKPESITWISMGSLRFPPDMKEKVLSKFPKSKIMFGEFIRGLDGKMRYIKPLRLELYRHVYRCLRKYGGDDLFIYFCMEPSSIWKTVFGWSPESNEHLDYLFAGSLYCRFPELMIDPPKREVYDRGYPLHKTPHVIPRITSMESSVS